MSLDYASVSVGDRLPAFSVQPTLRNAVMYAAAMWEFQRIHYDDQWAREQEGLPGAVVQGPVLGNYLVQTIAAWTGPQGALRRLEWRNHGLVAFGDDIRCEGTVVSKQPGDRSIQVGCCLEMLNQRNEKVVSATATVEIRAAMQGAT
jgi:hydroxyacyl-ACP dehydratase HTD2-like protein with hotdog domain